MQLIKVPLVWDDKVSQDDPPKPILMYVYINEEHLTSIRNLSPAELQADAQQNLPHVRKSCLSTADGEEHFLPCTAEEFLSLCSVQTIKVLPEPPTNSPLNFNL